MGDIATEKDPQEFSQPCKAEDTSLSSLSQSCLDAAIKHARHIVHDDGHWYGELCANATITAEYIFLYQALGLPIAPQDKESMIRYLVSQQQPDGSWAIAHDYPGDVSTTVEVYLALKILGLELYDAVMRKARNFVIKQGGLERVRIFTRFYLAMFGLWPWTAVPEMPPELILIPARAPVSIYHFSSWARSTTVPLLILSHHKPVFQLPNGTSQSSDYLDELWCNPHHKDIPYTESFVTLWQQSDWLGLLFTIADLVLSYICSLTWYSRYSPIRALAKKRCMVWILEHQEPEGDWAGIFPPMHFGILAFVLEGYKVTDDCVRKALEAIERFAWTDEGGKRIQSCVSPVWDTVLMSIGLCDAGVPGDHASLVKAIKWVKARQICDPIIGDWRVYSTNQRSAGFSFEYFNRWYPDVDDTAAVILAMIKQDSARASSESVIDAVVWVLGMQNQDGGWAAFDIDNDYLFLNKIPFSDMNSLCDPSSADVTGRVLEAMGLLMEKMSSKHALSHEGLLPAIKASVHRAIEYLAKQQESHGGWYGRWGSNYVYGTSHVLCGLAYWTSNPTARAMIRPALDWLKHVQNEGGGWGESLHSYTRPELAGQGKSTASQTAWGLMGLLAHLPSYDPAIERGVAWLLDAMKYDEEGRGTWPEREYTGTGFPGFFYIGYSLYPHYFPLMAMGRYRQAVKELR